MAGWDRFFRTYDTKTETYEQRYESEFRDRVKYLKKLGYLVATNYYRSPHGYSNNQYILRAIKTYKGKRGSILEKKRWVRF
jgi:hypothetical protein